MMSNEKRWSGWWWLTSIFLLLMVVSVFGMNQEAAASSPESSGASSEGGKLEKIVSTLNETLEENKHLRDEIGRYEAMIESGKTQSNLLMSQIRQLQAQAEDWKKEKQQQSSVLERQTADVEKEKESVLSERQALEEARLAAIEEKENVIAENAKLKEFIDHATLKGEERPYRNLLREASRSQKSLVKKLARVNRSNEKLKKQLAEQRYSLGNFYFESAQYKQAVKEYEEALRLNPRDSWAHHNLAVIFDFYLNKRKRAVYHYRKYLHLKPLQEEARGIRERILALELEKVMVPGVPLASEYNEYQKELKVKT